MFWENALLNCSVVILPGKKIIVNQITDYWLREPIKTKY
jgi:hypothetical protein